MNVCFEYLYRDAGNFKNWSEVVFLNRYDLDAVFLERQARRILISHEFFVASIADIPELFFKEYVESLDHDWHQFYLFKPTNNSPTDFSGRDIITFVDSLKQASRR